MPMILRTPNSWRRLERLVTLSSPDPARIRTGMWVTSRPDDAERVLVTNPDVYVDRSAFVRVDEERQFSRDVRQRVVRDMLAAAQAHAPRDWHRQVAGWVGDGRRMSVPGGGVEFVASAFADAVAFRRPPRLSELVTEFVRRNLVFRSVQGRRGMRHRHRLRSFRENLGPYLTDQPRGSAPDLVDAVGAVPDLTPDQRGELYLRLVVAMVGATGVALEWALVAAAGSAAGRDGTSRGVPRPDALVYETMRMSPASWLIAREAALDHELDGRRVRVGDRVLLLTYGLHRRASTWPAPDVFDPSRWNDASGRPSSRYLPFSAGPTTCPGRSVALRALVESTAAFTDLYQLGYRRRPGAKPYVRTLLAVPRGELHVVRRPGAAGAGVGQEDAPE